jgi:hypothetical protein
MNIWALEKDESIKLVLLLLTQRLGPGSFAIAEKQELDPRAIRLAKADEPAISAYLYTYGQEEGAYAVHLELPAHDELDISNVLEIYEGLGFERLLDILCVHFDLIPAQAEVREQSRG